MISDLPSDAYAHIRCHINTLPGTQLIARKRDTAHACPSAVGDSRSRRHQVPVVLWQTPVTGGLFIEYGLTGAPLGWTLSGGPPG
jgi:hypothetical protein